jgi:hypothetical protein
VDRYRYVPGVPLGGEPDEKIDLSRLDDDEMSSAVKRAKAKRDKRKTRKDETAAYLAAHPDHPYVW